MEYFVISDIHGYYTVMRDSLDRAGYDKNNPNHHLIVVGDMFDRGPQSKEVLEFLYPLERAGDATIILGNHDTFLLELFRGDYDRVGFNMLYNGFDKTLWSLSGIKPSYDNIDEVYDKIEWNYPYLHQRLTSLPYYYELGDYIFVHGGIDGGKLDWKTMSSNHEFIWSREHKLPKVEGKTVVAGHTRVPTIRIDTNDYHKLFLTDPKYFDILYLDGKILIDRYVEVSQELNVLRLSI